MRGELFFGEKKLPPPPFKKSLYYFWIMKRTLVCAILCALALDTGNGVRSINLDNIDENNYDCVIIIRAEFN